MLYSSLPLRRLLTISFPIESIDQLFQLGPRPFDAHDGSSIVLLLGRNMLKHWTARVVGHVAVGGILHGDITARYEDVEYWMRDE